MLRSQRSWPMRRIALPASRSSNSASVQREEFGEPRARPVHCAAGSRLGAHLRVAVPRAHELAVVAAVDAVADRGAELLGDRAVVLDRQVGDAAARVEPVGRHDRARGADVDAGRAAAAVAGHGRVDRQRQVGEYLAEEEPGTVLPVEQVGVLADPAEPRIARERLLEHRRAVGECAIARRRPPRRRAGRRGARVGCAPPCDSRGRARSATRSPWTRRRAPSRRPRRRASSPCARRSRAACPARFRRAAPGARRGAPCRPSRRGARRRASPAGAARPRRSSTAAMPTFWNPSSRPQAFTWAASAAGSMFNSCVVRRCG